MSPSLEVTTLSPVQILRETAPQIANTVEALDRHTTSHCYSRKHKTFFLKIDFTWYYVTSRYVPDESKATQGPVAIHDRSNVELLCGLPIPGTVNWRSRYPRAVHVAPSVEVKQ